MTRNITVALPYNPDSVNYAAIKTHIGDARKWLRGQGFQYSADLIEALLHAIEGPDVPLAADRDPDLWHVQVSVTRPAEGGWSAQRTLPTFAIDGAIQGIDTHRGAATLAADVLCVDLNPDWTYMAAVRNGGDDVVITFNLHTLTAYAGDHTTII